MELSLWAFETGSVVGESRQEREKIRICILGRGSSGEKPKELSGGTPQANFVYLGSWCFG